MPRTCRKCDQNTGPNRRLCKQCALEDRYGTSADLESDRWILTDRWHASTEFDGDTHTCACGAQVSTPVNWVSDDLRYVDSDEPVCEGCVAALDKDSAQIETVADDMFSRASELRADGGQIDGGDLE